MLDAALRALWCAGHGCVLGHGRGRHRHPLHQALDVGGRVSELLVDEPTHTFGHLFEVHEEVDEVPVTGVGRNAAGGGVRLGQVAEDRLTKYRLWSDWEPTGTALVVNSFTTARRIACFLFSICSWHSVAPSASYSTASAI